MRCTPFDIGKRYELTGTMIRGKKGISENSFDVIDYRLLPEEVDRGGK
jgi:hypothetical protein